jgi:two-component system, chemotaxis family, protein-glutamate methylesterase/glutaminase
MNAVRVLLVGSAPAFAARLRNALGRTRDLELAGEVFLSGEVMAAVRSLRPAVVVLDLQPPAPQGPGLLNDLLGERSLAMVAVLRPGDQPLPDVLLRGLGAGRLDLIRPPADASPEASEQWDRALVDLTTAIGRGRWTRSTPASSPVARSRRQHHARMIGIASSTGGPPALHRILANLPADLPVPLLLAQHISPGFIPSLLRWLSSGTRLELAVAGRGMRPLPGRVYLAPEGCDLTLGPELNLQIDASTGLHSPSADQLFSSMAAALGPEAAGVILTGMGSDGTKGLLAIRRAGGATLAQDESSSVVFGMPKAAIAAGAAGEVAPLDAIAPAIRELAGAPR